MQKTILITGAAAGIGLCATQILAKRGYLVYAGVRKQTDAERLNKIHQNIKTVLLDINDHQQQQTAFEFIQKHSGSLDALFNNAGIVAAGPLELASFERIRQQFDTNVINQITLTNTMLPLLRKSPSARIIFNGSRSGFLTLPLVGLYSATKFAIEAVCNALRIEVKGQGIFVSLLQTGPIKTDLWEKTMEEAQQSQQQADPNRMAFYQKMIDQAKRATVAKKNNKACDPELVVEQLIHALEARRPKPRYLFGPGRYLMYAFARFIPDRLRDWIILKFLG